MSTGVGISAGRSMRSGGIVMAIDYSQFAIPKGPSRYDTKKARQAEAENTERQVYAAVTLRDESCCRVCGRFCNPRAVSLLQRAHHHHITYRSRGGATSTGNVCLLCADCHDDEHKGKFQLSGDADQRDPISKRLNCVCVQRPKDGVLEIVAWT